MKEICNICGGTLVVLSGKRKCLACGAVYDDLFTGEEEVLLRDAFSVLHGARFEEAEEQFSDILLRYPENGEAAFGNLMAKYGVKFETDADGTKIPVFYKAPKEKMTEDALYYRALDNAGKDTADFYRETAKKLESVRKEWMEKAALEPSFDLFLSCKSGKEAEGGRAKELFEGFSGQKLNVFYSERSLQNKVGEKYEPYIYQAIEKSRVMVLYGRSAKEINSTWIRNEWHRYSYLIGKKKKLPDSLIVVCDGFPAKDLPKELSSFESLELKAGEDGLPVLLQQVKKVLSESKKQENGNYLPALCGASALAACAVLCFCLFPRGAKKTVPGTEPMVTEQVSFSSVPADVTTLPEMTSSDKITIVVPSSENTSFNTKAAETGSEKTEAATSQKISEETPSSAAEETAASSMEPEFIPVAVTETAETSEHLLPWEEPEETTMTEETPEAAVTGGTTFVPAFTTEVSETTPEEATAFVIGTLEDRYQMILNPDNSLVLKDLSDGFYYCLQGDGTYCVCGFDSGIAGEKTSLEIPEEIDGKKVTFICEAYLDYPALSSNSTVRNLVIPGSVKSIGGFSFKEWSALESVTLGEGLETIGTQAFYQCIRLKNINFPSTLRQIENNAFEYCYWLSDLVFNEGLEELGEYAFSYCVSLKAVVIPSTVERLGYGLFEECGGLESVKILTDKLTAIDGAFVRCRNLKELTIPDGVNEISSFIELEKLTYLEIPESVKIIAKNCFSGCTLLSRLYIKGNPDYIGDHLISGYPGGTIYFECEEASSGWGNFNEEGYRVVYGVKDCPAEEEYACIEPPVSGEVSLLRFAAVRGSDGNTYLYDREQHLYFTKGNEEYILRGYDGTGGKVYIPSEIHGVPVTGYIAAEGLPQLRTNDYVTDVYLPGTFSSVPGQMFYQMKGLLSVYMDDGVTAIEQSAFEHCDQLRSVRLPDSIREIGTFAFSCCQRLCSMELPESLETIGYQAFVGCASLIHVTIPAACKTVGDMAFYNCPALCTVYFIGNPVLGTSVFDYSNNVTVYTALSGESFNASGIAEYGIRIIYDQKERPY